MKKSLCTSVFALGIFLLPATTQAASLTALQLSSILSLLTSFGVTDATRISVINALAPEVCDTLETELVTDGSDTEPVLNAEQIARLDYCLESN